MKKQNKQKKLNKQNCRNEQKLKTVIFLIFLLFLMVGVFGFKNSIEAEIIFEDNFDNSPDWQSNQTVNKSQSGGYDISWTQTRSDICTTLCPPQGWTSYRAASSQWTDDRRKDTYILNSEGARGGTGKGITYNVEVSGDYGVWSGGSLDLWLGEEGYEELYIRYYLKYDINWNWTNQDNTQHCQQKLIRISTFNDDIWTTTYNPQQYGSASVNWPTLYPDWYYNASYPPAKMTMAVRKAPDYSVDETETVSGAVWPTDDNWHSYEFYVKMNSFPGVADGIWKVWIDGNLKGERTNVEWKMAGSNTTHNWNWLMFLDNVTNASATLDSHTEMSLYMDDVVISTSYIGPDYVIGNNESSRADVDNNSQINTTDAMLTLRNSLGLDMSGTNWQTSTTTGDVNCDGNSNSTDAMLILRYSLGLSMEGTGWCI